MCKNHDYCNMKLSDALKKNNTEEYTELYSKNWMFAKKKYTCEQIHTVITF